MHSGNRTAIYCRLSVEDMDKANPQGDSQSIKNQKLLLTEYAAANNWTIYKIYSDDDYSGLDRERPDFNKMLRDAEQGLFDIILCKTQSRFTRDMEMVEKYIHGLFVEWGIRFVSVIDNVDTNIKGNKKARQIYGLTNEWYCEELSENIKSVFRRKMEAGQYLGSFAPYGYVKSAANRHKLVIDHEASEIVKEIFRLYLQGYGCRQIADQLTAKEIPTPTMHKRNAGLQFRNPNSDKYSANYGIWASNTVRRILKNRVYLGDLIQGKEKKVSYKSKKVISAPKDEWVIIKDNHPSIIDEKTFNTVCALMGARRTVHKHKNEGGGAAQAYLLSGKVRCAGCGAIMCNSAPARNGDHYLRCGLAYKTRSRIPKCSPHTIKLETLTAEVAKKVGVIIDDYISDESEIDILKKYYLEQNDLEIELARMERENKFLKHKIEEISSVFTHAYADKTKEILTEDDFHNIRASLDTELRKTKTDQARMEKNIAEHMERINDKRNLLKGKDVLKSRISFKTLTHEMVNDFIDYIDVGERDQSGEQRIIIHWNF